MKPCPFCGSNEIKPHYFDEHDHHVLRCGNCGASGPPDISRPEEARRMWNLRRLTNALLASCEAFSDAHYIEDNQVNVDPQDWAKFDAAIAAARPASEPETAPPALLHTSKPIRPLKE